jgi:hypothetical protein
MSDGLDNHCDEIERCNQRGGRMLSIVDLIEAGTFSRELAAYALAAIGKGASFMVGALPGGAGKTTVMGALLNFVPHDVELLPADSPDAIRDGLAHRGARRCYICHEIGAGPYYAYLWGADLRAYFELASANHILATNLHADLFSQARDQVCRTNGVSDAAFRRMNLIFFLSVRRAGFGVTRRIATVWESDGASAHTQVFDAQAGGALGASRLVSAKEIAAARRTIDRLVESGARTIRDVRAAIVNHRA